MREDAPGQRSTLLAGLLSFLIIGGGAALSFVALSTVAIAVFSTTPAWIVSALCYAAHVLPVYLLHRRFSFQSDAAHGQALPRYVAVQLSAIGLATAFSWIAYGVFGLPSVVAAVLVTGLTSGVNFVVLRRWAFSDR